MIPFLAIGGFLGSVSVGAIAANIAISVGASLIAQSLARKQRPAGPPGMLIEAPTSGDGTPQTIVLGERAVSGHRTAPEYSRGNGKEWITVIRDVSDMPVDSLRAIWINNDRVAIPNPHTGWWEATGKYAGALRVRFYDGTQTAVDSHLRLHYGSHPDRPWLEDMALRGVAYVIVEMKRDQKLYPSMPDLAFEIRGAKLLDPRNGNIAWTNDAATIAYNLMIGITMPDGTVYGGGLTASDLPQNNWGPAITESRRAGWKANIEVNVGPEDYGGDVPADILDHVLQACAGQVAESGGRWRVRIGGPGLPVATFTSADMIVTEGQTFEPHKGPREIYSGIALQYVEPDERWKSKAAPIIFNQEYADRHGGRNILALTYPAVTDSDLAQILGQMALDDGQRQRIHEISAPPDYTAVEVLDTLSVTLPYDGYVSKLVEVIGRYHDPVTMNNRFLGREVEPSDFTPPAVGKLPTVSVVTTPSAPQQLPGWGVRPVVVRDSNGANRRSGVEITWTPLPYRGVEYQLKAAGAPDSELAGSNTTQDVGAGKWVITDGVMSKSAMLIRGRAVLDNRERAWTPWTPFTAAEAGFNWDDFGSDIREEIDRAIRDNAASAGVDVVDALPATGTPNQLVLRIPENVLYRWDEATQQWTTAIYAGIPDGSIEIAKFAQGIEPVTIISNSQPLPTTRQTATILWQGNLYRWSGTAYTKSVATPDLVGTITAEQIGTGAVLESKLAASAVTVNKVADAAIAAAKLAANSVTSDKINGLAVTEAKVAANAVSVNKIVNGAIAEAKLATNAVSADKIAALAITEAKLAQNAVTVGKIAEGSVTAAILAAGAVTSDKMADGAVGTAKFAAGLTPVEIVASLPTSGNYQGRTVTLSTDGKLYRYHNGSWTASIASGDIAGQITNAQIAAIAATKLTGQITGTQVSDGAISTPKIAAGAVTANEVAANTITAAKIATGAITANELAANAVTADKVAANSITSAKIAAGAVTANEIAANAIVASKLSISGGDNAFPDFDMIDPSLYSAPNGGLSFVTNSGAFPAAGSRYINLSYAGTDDRSVFSSWFRLSNSGPVIARGSHRSSHNGVRGILEVELATDVNGVITPTRRFTAYSSTSQTSVTLTGTGEVLPGETMFRFVLTRSINNTNSRNIISGGWSLRYMTDSSLIVDGAIFAQHLTSESVTTNAIAAGAITTEELAANAITSAKIAAGAITSNSIEAGSITSRELNTGAVTAEKVAANAVTAAKIAAGTITANEMAANSITTAKIATNAVTANEIAAGTVTATEIASNAITAVKISANAITSREIAGETITAAQIASNAVVARTIQASAVTATAIATGTITANEMASNSITSVKIAAGAVTANEIATNAITSVKIATGAVTANELAANAVIAGKIAAGAVRAQEIAANAVTASKLLVSNFTNLILNSDLADLDGWQMDADISHTTNPPGNGTAQGNFVIPATITSNRTARWGELPSRVSVMGGEQYILGADFRGSGTQPIFFTPRVAVWIYDAAGGLVSSIFRSLTAVTNTGYNTRDMTFTIPTNGAFMRFGVGRASTSSEANTGYIENPFCRRLNGGELLVDGAITTNKLSAGAVTADTIAAGAIVAGKLAAGSVAANNIAANAVTAEKINVANLQSVSANMGVLTAGTIRSGTSGERFVLTPTGLSVFDSSGTLRVRMGLL